MGFFFDSSYIRLSNPYPASQPFKFAYEVDNTGPDDAGHDDRVQMWSSSGTVVLDRTQSAPPSVSGGRYGVLVDVPALEPGYYDVSVTLFDGTAAGSTAIVQ